MIALQVPPGDYDRPLAMSDHQRIPRIHIQIHGTGKPRNITTAVFECNFVVAHIVMHIYFKCIIVIFQLLNNSETTQIGGIILGAQLAVAVAVTYFVVKKAKSELDKSLKDKLEQEEAEEMNAELDIGDLDMAEKGRVNVEVPEKTISQLIWYP